MGGTGDHRLRQRCGVLRGISEGEGELDEDSVVYALRLHVCYIDGFEDATLDVSVLVKHNIAYRH
jgi:hypothetical protein